MRRLLLALLCLSLVAFGAPLVAPGPAGAQAVTSRFQAVGPVRLLDTRDLGARPGAGSVLTVPVTAHPLVPDDATAAVLTVTVTDTAAQGFVTVWPAGEAQPLASNLNVDQPGTTVPNLVTVRLGGGAVSIFIQPAAHVVVDVSGVFRPASSATSGRLVTAAPVPLPQRVLDTRDLGAPLGQGGLTRVTMPSWVPRDATAAVVNLTITETFAPGFWTAFPSGTNLPLASSVNASFGGQTVASQAIVPLGNGAFDVFAQTGGHLIVDVAGYFTGVSAPLSTSGLFVPVSPSRLLDTREGGALNPLGAGVKPQAQWTVEVPVVGRAGVGAAAAASFNVTLTSTRGQGFVTAWPAGSGRPNASTINATGTSQTIANHALIPLGSRGLSLFTQSGAHMIVDVNGWYTGAAVPASQPTPSNPPLVYPAAPFRLTVPRIGLDTRVLPGIDDATLNTDPGHWPGTSLPGQLGNMAIFGHRTSYGAEFRITDQLQFGDMIYFEAGDMTAAYKITAVYIVGPTDARAVLGPGHGASVTLVSCHPPGSVAYRLVVEAGLECSVWR
jgi:LPXTG-site transpeptidase (sortase) family protein